MSILSLKQSHFKLLLDLHNSGINLMLVGPDGYPLTDPHNDYLDTSKPFGHEKV